LPACLPEPHYASGWNVKEGLRPSSEVNLMGREYARTKNQELFLELCKCFHPYLMKYVVMICRGHLPVIGSDHHAGHCGFR
jgi:hypothetical protein